MHASFRVSLTAIFASFVLAATAFAATAAQPVMIVGSACPAGSARAYKWVVFEDHNGDGQYDYIIQGGCDGSVVGRNWDVQSDPFEPTSGDILIGRMPAGIVGVNPQLVMSMQQPDGLYTWTLVEYASTGAEACRYERNAAQELASTCPPDGNFH